MTLFGFYVPDYKHLLCQLTLVVYIFFNKQWHIGFIVAWTELSPLTKCKKNRHTFSGLAEPGSTNSIQLVSVRGMFFWAGEATRNHAYGTGDQSHKLRR